MFPAIFQVATIRAEPGSGYCPGSPGCRRVNEWGDAVCDWGKKIWYKYGSPKNSKSWYKSWWTNGGFVNAWAIYAKSSWGAVFQCCLMSQNESKWDLRLEKVRNDQNPLKKSSNWGLCSQCCSISARDSGQKSRRVLACFYHQFPGGWPEWPADVPIIRCALVRPLKLRNEPWDRPEVLEIWWRLLPQMLVPWSP